MQKGEDYRPEGEDYDTKYIFLIIL